MIRTLDELPQLTKSWTETLETDDPEVYSEIAANVIITNDGEAPVHEMPSDLGSVLEQLNLHGKEIGAFRFAPAEGKNASESISSFNREVRQNFEFGPNITFIGSHGPNLIFASKEGIGLLNGDKGRIVALAPDFTDFLLVQANAYDAAWRLFKGKIDRNEYDRIREMVESEPAFAKVNVFMVFEAELKS